MRNLLRASMTAVMLATSTVVLAQSNQSQRNDLAMGCARTMMAGADGLPWQLSMNICLCVASSMTDQDLQAIGTDASANTRLLRPYTEKCTQRELPKYMQSHPKFLKKYILSHPEVLNSGSDR